MPTRVQPRIIPSTSLRREVPVAAASRSKDLSSMNTRSILLANEPRAYREAMAAALVVLQAHVNVVVADPDDLNEAIACDSPHVVVCDRMTSLIETAPFAWLLLYPSGSHLSVMSIGGEQYVLRVIAEVVAVSPASPLATLFINLSFPLFCNSSLLCPGTPQAVSVRANSVPVPDQFPMIAAIMITCQRRSVLARRGGRGPHQ
jgi:hypothetical protein